VLIEIEKRLKGVPEDQRIVYIKAAEEVRFETVTGVIDDLRAKGLKRIGILAEKKEGRLAGDFEPGLGVGSLALRENYGLTVSVEPIPQGSVGVKVGNVNVRLRDLSDTVHTRLKGQQNKSVMIQAPGSTRWGRIVEVIDSVKAGGAEVIGMRARP
jgi:biopolymer transport protein ExbD